MYDVNGQLRECVGELIIDNLDLDKRSQPGQATCIAISFRA